MRLSIGRTMQVVIWVAGLASATNACALTSKAAVVDVRYFSPERVKPRLEAELSDGLHAGAATNQQLRLGRVTSSQHLRERIAFRNSEYELGYYEDLRWTERPEAFVRRALGRSLFETHAMHRVVAGMAPTLDIELVAFDDVQLSASRTARIQLKCTLYDYDNVIFEDTISIDNPVAGENPKIEDVIAAMAAALETVANQVAIKVKKALTARELATPPDSAP